MFVAGLEASSSAKAGPFDSLPLRVAQGAVAQDDRVEI